MYVLLVGVQKSFLTIVVDFENLECAGGHKILQKKWSTPPHLKCAVGLLDRCLIACYTRMDLPHPTSYCDQLYDKWFSQICPKSNG